MATTYEIEAAAKAAACEYGPNWDYMDPDYRQEWRNVAKAALEAAEKVRHSSELPEPNRSSHYS
jgi:hypothetical protein